MSDRSALWLARAVFALATVSLVGGGIAALLLTAGGADSWRGVLPDIAFTTAMNSFAIVGYIILRRQPRNAVGWVLLVVGLLWATEMPIGSFLAWAKPRPEMRDSAAVVAAFWSASWAPSLAPLGTFLLLLFPDGHLPSQRWRWWAWLCGIVLALAYVGMIVVPGPIQDVTPRTMNPLGLEVLEPIAWVVYVPIMMIPLTMVGCAVALVRRYRRSRGVERLQMKWLTATAAVVAAVYLFTMIVSAPYDWTGTAPGWVSLFQNVSLFTFMLIPIAVGIAITRYRLYDIDRLINRALVYGAVSAMLVIVYVLGVVGAGAGLRAITGSEQGNLAVAGSTLAVAALFRPFRSRVQRFIDRRFYRQRYNAARTVESFSASLRHETDLQTLSDELSTVVSETVQPARLSLWIASRG